MPPAAPAFAPSPRRVPPLALALLAVALLLSLAAALLFDQGSARNSVFTLSNFVGPTAATLLHHQGLLVCSDGMGTTGHPICFHSARMPIASAVVALGDVLFGDHYLRVGVFKTLLLLAPLFAAMLLVLRRLPAVPARRNLTLALLLLPFLLTPFLADVVNLQVEEGYSYSLLALAFALVLFPERRSAAGRPRRSWPEVLLFVLASVLLYLSKSSMAPAVAVLTGCFLFPVRRDLPRVALTLVLIALAPAGWAAWQHHSSGRFTFGTSLDGDNLHKGNNPDFLARYPPAPGYTLDLYDDDLNRGLVFANEWAFNDFHQRAALAYIRAHPAATTQADLRKLQIVFVSLGKVGSHPRHGLMAAVETAGLILFRLLFWAALLFALRSMLLPGRRAAAAAFLLLVAAVALPYVVGFAYTRHVSVLIYPSALFLCALLQLPPAVSAHRDPTR